MLAMSYSRRMRGAHSSNPFTNLDCCKRCLELQYRFYHDIDPLYRHEEIVVLLPDAERRRRRIDFVAADMAIIGVVVPSLYPSEDYLIDFANALGWLYFAEALHFETVFFLRQACLLGSSISTCARHSLAASSDYASQWQIFVRAFDGVDLDGEAERRAMAGAGQAYAHLHSL